MSFATRVQAVQDAVRQACAACDRDPAGVQVLPISKRHSLDAIRAVRRLGFGAFGENRVQELLTKDEEFGDDAPDWQMIGSVQSNKVAALLRVQSLTLVHSMDRPKLARALQAGLAERGQGLRVVPVLLQVHATGEAEKHGVAPSGAPDLLRMIVAECPLVEPVGVMAMGPREGDPAPVFQAVAELHEDLRQQSGLPLPVRSIGMTGDLAAAVAAGSTMVRVGTGIFGPRTG